VAFAAAEVVVRGRYDVQRYTGMPLETRGIAAEHDAGTDRLTVWSSTQWPHTLRDVLAGVLGMATHRSRVITPDVGGGFGVRQEGYPEEIVVPCWLRHTGDGWSRARMTGGAVLASASTAR